MKKLNFCYIVNDNKKFLDLLIISLYSLIKYYDNINNVYIISTAQFDNEYKNILYKISNKIIIKNVDEHIVDVIKYPIEASTANRVSKVALLKFFIPNIIDCDNTIYVDCDILFYNNCTNELLNYIDDDILIKMYGLYKLPNSGLIYINCDKWRNDKNILNQIKKYYNSDCYNHYFVDQSCFIHLTILYEDNCIIDNHQYINIYKSYEELNDFNCFILHIIGEDKQILLDVFNNIIRDEKFNKLNYKNLYFTENSNT